MNGSSQLDTPRPESTEVFPIIQAMCEECLRLVPARLFKKGQELYCRKLCPQHGVFVTLISTDLDYYRWTQRVSGSRQYKNNISTVIIELLDECNMQCPTCIAGSSPIAGNVRTFDALRNRLDWLSTLSPMPQMVMLSGGEPTIHPDINRLLTVLEDHTFAHLMLITNGVRISEDKRFVSALARVPRLEVYLQFDSLNDAALLDIRGSALRQVRLHALHNLREAAIPTSLVCVVKRGVNEQEIPELIQFARGFDHVRGITFQPLKFMGRTVGSRPHEHMITLSETRENILRGYGILETTDLQPHPVSPETICIGYLSRLTGRSMTKEVNRYFLECHDSDPANYAIPLLLPPTVRRTDLHYDDLFRIAIVSYMDRFTFNDRVAASPMIAFATDNHTLIPVDRHYLVQPTRLTSIVVQ